MMVWHAAAPGAPKLRRSSSQQRFTGNPIMQKVLLIIGDAAEVFDTLYPLHRVKEEDFEVVVAGPEKRVYHLVQHDRHPEWDITVESPGYRLAADIAFRDIQPSEYLGMVITGGRAPEYLRYDRDLLRLTRWFFEKNLPVASVCHGIEVIATAGVIKSRTVTTVAKCRFDAEVCGATYVDQPVVVSGNLVTARTWHDNWIWMREYMKLLRAAREAGGTHG
jgi:protease I